MDFAFLVFDLLQQAYFLLLILVALCGFAFVAAFLIWDARQDRARMGSTHAALGADCMPALTDEQVLHIWNHHRMYYQSEES